MASIDISTLPYQEGTIGTLARGTIVRIESLPDRKRVYKGVHSKNAIIDLDPGYYCAVVRKVHPNGKAKMVDKKVVNFYHELSPEQFELLQNWGLRFTQSILTSDGMRYNCVMPVCANDFSATSKTAAILHECEHLGINPFATGPASEKAILKVDPPTLRPEGAVGPLVKPPTTEELDAIKAEAMEKFVPKKDGPSDFDITRAEVARRKSRKAAEAES